MRIPEDCKWFDQGFCTLQQEHLNDRQIKCQMIDGECSGFEEREVEKWR